MTNSAPPTSTVCTAGAILQLRPGLVGAPTDLTSTTLTFGLFESSDGQHQELHRKPGYARQPAPRWAVSRSGELSMSDVSFDIDVEDAASTHLTLFSDDVLVASGGARVKDTRAALPGQGEFIFVRGSLRVAA